eukprot:NODE_3194_length_377_cov_22.362805_g3112_i0.p1 GENE.NODE_3194_length_377_cov_22.362805_g3112_i0~~NODE_3194_length_377_cov_22.362805_g3112_i0.p1  ORF type:complete len:69 (+),score=4.37 NODE_3194_length_377_cov_22.362805_g3112_i0:159-365(+)
MFAVALYTNSFVLANYFGCDVLFCLFMLECPFHHLCVFALFLNKVLVISPVATPHNVQSPPPNSSFGE